MLASDDANREFAGARNPDDVLSVQFYIRAVQDNFQSEKQQRPIFRDEEFVRISIPGRLDTVIDRPVEVNDQFRFPRQWAIYRNAREESSQQVGTPIAELPGVTASQAEELRAKKFYTIEQVAECSDAQIAALGMNAGILRQRAQGYLSRAKGAAAALELEEKLKQRDDEISSLKNQMAELIEAVKAGQQQKPAKAAKPAKKGMSDEARAAAKERMRLYWEKKKGAQTEATPDPQ